jgi:hypothetical protein
VQRGARAAGNRNRAHVGADCREEQRLDRDLFLVINRPISGRHALRSNRKRYSFPVDDFLLGGEDSSSGVVPGKVTVRLEPSLHDSLYPTFGGLAQPSDRLGRGVR